jgi:hypothetical protein
VPKSLVTPALSASALALATGLLLNEPAQAATSIAANQTTFTLDVPQTVNVQASSWFKPAFGNSGWTHFSKWGVIRLRTGQRISLTARTSSPGLHPGVSIWFRQTGKAFMPLHYFQGHSYNEYNSILARNLSDDETGKRLGHLRMDLAANGYDRDGMAQLSTVPANAALNPLQDGIVGQVKLDFRAKKAGWYQFVVGGINPDVTTATAGGFDNNMVRWPVEVKISRTR